MDEEFNRAAIEAINAARGDYSRRRAEQVPVDVDELFRLTGELFQDNVRRGISPSQLCVDVYGQEHAVWGLDNHVDEGGIRHHFYLSARGVLVHAGYKHSNRFGHRYCWVPLDKEDFLTHDDWQYARESLAEVLSCMRGILEERSHG